MPPNKVGRGEQGPYWASGNMLHRYELLEMGVVTNSVPTTATCMHGGWV
jgi:hypothetical protein